MAKIEIAVGLNAYEIEDDKAEAFNKEMIDAEHNLEVTYAAVSFPGCRRAMVEAIHEKKKELCAKYGAKAID